MGPMLSLKGIDNLSYYRCSPEDPRYYMDFTGTGNSLNPLHPQRAAADHGQPALLGARDARRRLPLRPRLGAGARVLGGRSPVGLLRHHPPGPGAVAGEADRRAVGRRARRVPGGQLPGAVDRVERPLPRRDARLLARPDRRRRRASRRASPDRATSTRPTAAARSRPSTSSPRTTASRWPTWSPTTTSTTRPTSRTTATAPTTTAAGTAAPRGRPTTPRSSRCAPASSATSWPPCCSRRACRCWSAATRWAAPRAATTTATARTTRSAGSTGTSTSEQVALLDFTRRLIQLRRAHPVFHRRDFFGGESNDGSGLPDLRWFRADGREMSRKDWRRSDLRVLGVFLNGEEIPSPELGRRPGGRRVVRDADQRGPRGHAVPAAGPPLRQPLAAGDLHGRARGARGLAQLAGAHRRDAGAALTASCCAAPGEGHLPTPARAGPRLRRGPRAGAVPAPPRGEPPLPLPQPAGALRLDPRLRRHRPAAHLRGPGRRGGVPRAGRRPASAWCSTSCPTTWRHPTRTRSGPIPQTRERYFDIDPRTGRHRRFFSIDELAGVRVEDPEVFEVTQRLAVSLVAEGLVDGLRIDHPDGLADPGGYLRRLQELGVEHVWVEKILQPGEELPDWPVEGTTGIRVHGRRDRAVHRPGRRGAAHRALPRLTGERREFADLADEAMRERGPHDLRARGRAPARSWWTSPTWPTPSPALPVYRTYVEPETEGVEEQDLQVVEEAELPERVRDALVDPSDPDEEAFAVRFQQTTGAVMAKGVEDTALYRYTRLAGPQRGRLGPGRLGPRRRRGARGAAVERSERFPLRPAGHADARHQALGRRARAHRRDLVDPGEWREIVERWWRDERPAAHGGRRPSPDEEYLDLPDARRGLAAGGGAAARLHGEGDARGGGRPPAGSSRTRPTRRAVLAFCDALCGSAEFVADLETVARAHRARSGEASALGQTLLKLTAPGVPDIYQGDELWDLALVDPDNRRPVDWDLRETRCWTRSPRRALRRRETAKMFLIHRALALRERRPEAFAGVVPPARRRRVGLRLRARRQRHRDRPDPHRQLVGRAAAAGRPAGRLGERAGRATHRPRERDDGRRPDRTAAAGPARTGGVSAAADPTRGRPMEITRERLPQQPRLGRLVHRRGLGRRDRRAPAAVPRPTGERALRPRCPGRLASPPQRPDPPRHRGRRPRPASRRADRDDPRRRHRVWFAPDEEHWHGAAPGNFMTHLAMHETDDTGESTHWGAHVTDAEYGAERG